MFLFVDRYYVLVLLHHSVISFSPSVVHGLLQYSRQAVSKNIRTRLNLEQILSNSVSRYLCVEGCAISNELF